MSDNIIFKEGDFLLTNTKLQAGENTYFLKTIGSISVSNGSNIIVWFLYFLGGCSILNSLIGEGWWFFPIGALLIFSGYKLKDFFCFLLIDTSAGKAKMLKGYRKTLLKYKSKIEDAIEAVNSVS